MGVKGFRSEWCLRTPELLKTISSLFEYDSSVPSDTDWFSVNTRSGAAHAFPFQLQDFPMEVPLTLSLGISRADMGRNVSWFWDRQLERARRAIQAKGIIHVVIHPTALQAANEDAFKAIELFFQKLVELAPLWKCSPLEVAHWTKQNQVENKKAEKKAA